jgi:collagen type VI alpha
MWIFNNPMLFLVMIVQAANILFSECKRKIDIAFVIDQSGSITDKNPPNGAYDNWELIKDFVINIVDYFNVAYDETRVGAVTFGNQGIVRFYLSNYTSKSDIFRAIRTIPAGIGQTNTYEGLQKMRRDVFNEKNGDRPDVPNVGVVITDGESNINDWLTVGEAEAARSQGIKLFSVGVTNDVNLQELRDISSYPHEEGKNFWRTPNFTSLNNIIESLQRETCEETPVIPGNMYKVDTNQ